MRRLSTQQLEEVFLGSGVNPRSISTAWVIINRAEHEKGIDLRHALECVRMQSFEVSVFVEKILQPCDLDDVVYVIEKLSAELTDVNVFAPEALRMLQSWRAKRLMKIVIEKRNATID